MTAQPTYAPHEQRVMQEKTELHAMNGYSAILGLRIDRFVPQSAHPAVAAMQPLGNDGTPAADPDDFPLGKACDLSGDGTCEACQ